MATLEQIQVEVDAAYLYKVLAENETDEAIKEVFQTLSEIEHGHALSFLEANNLAVNQMPGPSLRAKILERIGKLIGFDYILGILLDTEKSISNSIISTKKRFNKRQAVTDSAHVKVLQNVIAHNNQVTASSLVRFEGRHRSIGGNALRAAVLGGNDGLVSNFSLIMGVAGAASGQKEVLLAGIAGLLAGALSMSLGEWISVKSSQELYENQMEIEMQELELNPEAEEKELALIYRSKGIHDAQAKAMAAEIIKDKDKAHAILVREELGINPDELSDSPMEAAIFSFILFAIGAVIPLFPFFFGASTYHLIASVIVSTIGLFLIGAAITLFTAKSVWKSGLRQVLFGLLAAAITFGIGKLIGVGLS